MAENQEFKILITGDSASAVSAFTKTGDASKDLGKQIDAVNVTEGDAAKTLDKVGDNAKDAGDKMKETGGSANFLEGRSRELHHVFGKLNQIFPGLGEGLKFVKEGFFEEARGANAAADANEAYAATAPDVEAANAKMAASSVKSAGIWAIVILAIEAVMTYWDLYKEKVENTEKAQEEAMKKIQDASAEALKAVRELDEALHPKEKNLATQDEEVMKGKLEALDNQVKRQKELNKAEEENRLAAAQTPEQKNRIKEDFDQADKKLDEWAAKQKARIEEETAQIIQGQITAIEKQKDAAIKEQARQFQTMTDAKGQIEKLQQQRDAAHTTTIGPGGMPVEIPDTAKIAELDKQIAAANAAKAAAQIAYNDITKQIEKLKGDAGPLGEKRDEISRRASKDANQAAFDAGTNAAVDDKKLQGQHEEAARQQEQAGIDIAKNIETGKGATPDQQDFLIKQASKISGHTVTLAQAVQVFETAANSQTAFAEQVHRAATALASLNPQQTRNLQDAVSRLEKEVERLNGQMKNTGFNGR
jgi:hypothetical protein